MCQSHVKFAGESINWTHGVPWWKRQKSMRRTAAAYVDETSGQAKGVTSHGRPSLQTEGGDRMMQRDDAGMREESKI